MVSMVERMLALADELVDQHPRSSAARRRAVSTAYYATFHALAQACVDAFDMRELAEPETYRRMYRALDHGAARNALNKPGPVRSSRVLREILELVDQLRLAREDADYAPPSPGFIPVAEAREHIERARQAIHPLNELSDEERVTLAASLLLRSLQDRRG